MDYTWLDGIRHELINPELVSYPRFKRVKVDGRWVQVKLEPLEYTIVTAKRCND